MFSTPLAEAIAEAESLVAAAPFIESEADLLSPLFTPLDVLNQLLRAARAQSVKEKRTRPFAGVNGELCKEEGKRKEQSIKRLDARHC